MFKLTIIFSLFCFSLKAQNYTFNTKNDSVFYTDMVNEFYTSIGTPMCFDGTLKIHPTNKMGQYLIEVLDKNQLYVNLSEIEDESYRISNEEIELNYSFYNK